MRSRSVLLFTALAALTLFLFLLDLAVGAVAVRRCGAYRVRPVQFPERHL